MEDLQIGDKVYNLNNNTKGLVVVISPDYAQFIVEWEYHKLEICNIHELGGRLVNQSAVHREDDAKQKEIQELIKQWNKTE